MLLSVSTMKMSYLRNLTIKIVLRIIVEVALITGCAARLRCRICRRREAEVCAETARLLQRLGKHFVLADVVVGNRSACKTHRLFKMRPRYLRDRIFLVQLKKNFIR